MNLIILLYILSLFVILTPGIFFTISKKNFILSIIIHGLLFSTIVYFSIEFLFNKKIIEGNTESNNYELNIGNLASILRENIKPSTTSGSNGQQSRGSGQVTPNPQNTSTAGSRSATVTGGTGGQCITQAQLQAGLDSLKTQLNNFGNTNTDLLGSKIDNINTNMNGQNFRSQESGFVCYKKLENPSVTIPINANSEFIDQGRISNGWYSNSNGVTIANSSYPDLNGNDDPKPSDQNIIVQQEQGLSTTIHLQPGNYYVSFYGQGIMNMADQSIVGNPIKITMNNVSDTKELNDASWKQYTTNNIEVATTGDYQINIEGTAAVAGIRSAIKDFVVHRA